jgi:sulfate transport system permease protein
VLAAVTAIINIVGTLIAYVLVRYRFPGRGWLSTIVDIPFAIPTLVTGVMLRALYGPNSLIGGFLEGNGVHVIFAQLGILLALLFVTLPLVVRTVQPVLLEIDEAEEKPPARRDRWYTFRRVAAEAPPHAAEGCSPARAIGELAPS